MFINKISDFESQTYYLSLYHSLRKLKIKKIFIHIPVVVSQQTQDHHNILILVFLQTGSTHHSFNKTMSITPATRKITYKTISAYDLSSNDKPGAVILQPLLNGLNYDEWTINFRMAISSWKKFEFLDGNLPKPTADSSYLEVGLQTIILL